MTSAEIEKARWRLAERKKAALAKVREASSTARTWAAAVAIVPEGEAREKALSAAERASEKVAKAKAVLPEIKAAYEDLMAADVGAGPQRLAAYRRAVAELKKAAA